MINCRRFIPSLFMMVLSSVLACISLMVSLSNPGNLLPGRCNSLPNISYLQGSNTNLKILEKDVISIIDKAQKSIYFTACPIEHSSEVWNSFLNIMDAIRNAKNRGCKVKFLVCPDSQVESAIRDIANPYTCSAVSPLVAANAIVADDHTIFVPFITNLTSSTYGSHNMYTFIDFGVCNTIAQEVRSFFNYYIMRDQEQLDKISDVSSTVLTSDTIARSSPAIPTEIQGSQLYFFQNEMNPRNIFPLSELTTNNMLPKILLRDPKFIYFYSDSIPKFITGQRLFDDFSLYMSLRSSLIRNNTQIYFLGEKTAIMARHNWTKALSVFPNFHIKIYDKKYLGPTFLVADRQSLVFSRPIQQDQKDCASLHFGTDSISIAEQLIDFFTDVWNKIDTTEFE